MYLMTENSANISEPVALKDVSDLEHESLVI